MANEILIKQGVNTREWKHEIILTKSDLREWLKLEEKNYPKKTIIDSIVAITEHGLLYKYQKRLRITEYHLNRKHWVRYFISRTLLHRMQFKWGMKLRLNSCGRGLRIVHQGDITTNGDVGENAILFPNTLIGANGRGDEIPVLGNNVIVCHGAVILGGVSIAERTIIGANAVVTKSFLEKDISIAGVPARKIGDKGVSAWG